MLRRIFIEVGVTLGSSRHHRNQWVNWVQVGLHTGVSDNDYRYIPVLLHLRYHPMIKTNTLGDLLIHLGPKAQRNLQSLQMDHIQNSQLENLVQAYCKEMYIK
jgi:hypothetical protein